MHGGIPKAPNNSFLPKSWSEQKIFKFFKVAAIIGFVIGALSLYYCQYVDFEAQSAQPAPRFYGKDAEKEQDFDQGDDCFG